MTPTGPEEPWDVLAWLIAFVALTSFGLTTGALIGLSLQRLGVLP